MSKRACLGAVLGAALALVVAPAASAHAAYKDSTPADGATVSAPPSQVTAEFTEPITDSSYLEVYDPCGQRVDNADSQVSGYNMSISMSGDKAGKYTVEFAAQSIDTHITYGSFSFTSSGGSACAGEEPQEPGNGGGSGGGGGGPAGGGGGGTSGGGGGSGSGSGSGMGAVAQGDGGSGSRGSEGPSKHRKHEKAGGKGGKRPEGSSDRKDPVSFENTGGRAPAPEPAAWDLPIGGVLMALALCVMIGAAGGRVYAGIVAPPRR